MPRGSTANRTDFDELLVWIAQTGDSPGEAYERLRIRLIKILSSRGCYNADELTDETIDRVTKKVRSVAKTYEGDPRLYFYAVAKNVFREHLRKPKPDELPMHLVVKETTSEELEARDRCLSSCMGKLSEGQRDFILEYYSGDRSVKIQNRQKIMERLDISPQTLRVRAFRIRSKLQDCVKGCVGGND